MPLFLQIALILTLLAPGIATYADTYSYVAADGTVVFTDDPTKVPRKQKNVKKISDDDQPVQSVQPPKRSSSPPAAAAGRRHEQKDRAEVSKNLRFYTIGGYTFKDLLRQIFRTSPKRTNGKVAVAWCQWQVNWYIHTRTTTDNHCAVDWVDTTVAYSITMPRWSNLASADKGMKETWQTYYAGVLAHEETHANHGVSAGNEIQRRLSDLGGAVSCQSLVEEGNQLANAIVKKYRAQDVEFDRVSGDDFDTLNEAMMAGDKADGVFGRQYPTRQKL